MTTKSARASSLRAAGSTPGSTLAASAPIGHRPSCRKAGLRGQASGEQELQAGQDEAEPATEVVQQMKGYAAGRKPDPSLAREELEEVPVQDDHPGDRDDRRAQKARSPNAERQEDGGELLQGDAHPLRPVEIEVGRKFTPLEDESRPRNRSPPEIRADHRAQRPPLQVSSQQLLVEHDAVPGAAQPTAELDVLDRGVSVSR